MVIGPQKEVKRSVEKSSSFNSLCIDEFPHALVTRSDA